MVNNLEQVFSIINLILSAISAISVAITAFFTFIMSSAIVITALIAFNTIKENRRIEQERIDLQRKSLAKNLLLEVRDNNFALDKAMDDLSKLSEKTIEENRKNMVPKLVFIFIKKTAYQSFINRFLNIDFRNDQINPLIREYYSEIESLENSIKLYNDTFSKLGNIGLIKLNRILSLGTIIMLKNRKIDKGLKKMLEIEADFNLRKRGLDRVFKPSSIEDLIKLIGEGKELGFYKE